MVRSTRATRTPRRRRRSTARSPPRPSSARRRETVLRTRLLLAPDCDWQEVVRAHREAFVGDRPANTTYFVAGFIPDGVLVEVELDALAADDP